LRHHPDIRVIFKAEIPEFAASSRYFLLPEFQYACTPIVPLAMRRSRHGPSPKVGRAAISTGRPKMVDISIAFALFTE